MEISEKESVKEQMKNQILDFLKKNGETAITKLGTELEFGHYLVSLKLLPELIKEKKVEIFKKKSAFYSYVKLKEKQ